MPSGNVTTLTANSGIYKISDNINNATLLQPAVAETTSQFITIGSIVSNSLVKDLHIDQDYTFYNSEITLSEGESIIIDAGKTLTLYNTIVHGCNGIGGLWRNITINADARLNILGDDLDTQGQRTVQAKKL